MAVTTNYGAAPTYVKIATQTLASAAASVTFSNIPQEYTDLVVEVVIGNSANGTRDLQWKLNGDSSSNYSSTDMQSEGSAAYSGRDTNFTYLRSNGSSNNTPSTYTRINFMNYSNATTFKSMLSRSNAVSWYVITKALLWRSTSPITSIVFTSESSSNFVTGSTFTMYGIKAALVPKATGGDSISQDGQYWYHTFRTTSSFQPKQALTCDVLVVAGGGAAGANQGGGGGAGGLRALSSQLLDAGINYSCTIGAGGASTNYVGGGNTAASGSNSSFIGSSLSISATGGGGGGNQGNAASGGSGGGGTGNNGSNASGNAGSYSPVEGFAGAPGRTSGGQWGGGGGGAGGAAENPNTTSNATGGIGATSSLINSMGAATTTGQLSGGNYYYAGGGGGCKYQLDGYSGGLGGGGAGGQATGSNAVVNTGGGGGGQSAGGNGYAGAGGSGIVIVRYAI